MNKKLNINSQLDALKMKEIEKSFYNNIDANTKIIPKVTPFKGINTDAVYIKENKLLFIKFMDTSEDLFSILEEELIEVMKEEYDFLRIKMAQHQKYINYNYVFIMPYVEIKEEFEFGDFIKSNIIDKVGVEELKNNKEKIYEYLKDENLDIELNLCLLDICPEYYVINEHFHYNKDFKKIRFYSDDYEYSAVILDNDQVDLVDSINYGKTLYSGGAGTGKTTLMLSKAIKLARIYPHHRFIIFTHTKQLCTELREKLALTYKDNQNLEVHTFKTFIFKLAKKYNLILDYSMLKSDYDRVFNNLIKQAKNIIKNKKIFKGIFIDEIESFSSNELDFIQEFLYNSKYIFNGFSCDTLNIYNSFNLFKNNTNLMFDENVKLSKDYRQSIELINFVNKFSSEANSYLKGIREDTKPIYEKTNPKRTDLGNVNVIKVSDLDDQISSVMWEIDYFINKKGMKTSDIAVVYPFNKKKLKNGKTIYFQYMLKKALEDKGIPFILGEDDLTNLSTKTGITLSNIYTVKNLEYKCVILCELEMLYNHKISDIEQDYQINDFVGDLNKLYLSMTRATDYLSIITTFDENSSDIIKLIINSNKK